MISNSDCPEHDLLVRAHGQKRRHAQILRNALPYWPVFVIALLAIPPTAVFSTPWGDRLLGLVCGLILGWHFAFSLLQGKALYIDRKAIKELNQGIEKLKESA